MTGNRIVRRGVAGSPEPKLGYMFLVSLGLHLAVFLVFTGILLPRFSRPRQTVYYVDLVNPPVERPQAGRPDARPAKPEPKPKPKPKPQPQPKPKAPPAPKPEPVRPPAVKTVPKAPARPKPKPAPKPAPPAASYQDVQQRIAAMQRKQELEELKAKLARLAAGDSRDQAPPAEVPLGIPEGQGDQAGPSDQAYLRDFLKANWALSKYQVTSRNPEVEVHVVYDAAGNLLDYDISKASGDQAFDDSVKRAILRSKKLPVEPGHRIEEDLIFNLKDLME